MTCFKERTHVYRTESWLRPPIGVRPTTSPKFFLGILKKVVDTTLGKVYHAGYGRLYRSLHPGMRPRICVASLTCPAIRRSSKTTTTTMDTIKEPQIFVL